jgi:hypothetical protein
VVDLRFTGEELLRWVKAQEAPEKGRVEEEGAAE